MGWIQTGDANAQQNPVARVMLLYGSATDVLELLIGRERFFYS